MWVWEADKDKIDEAQKAYDDFIKQEKIDELEKEKKQWDDYVTKVEKSSEQFQKEVNKQVAAMKLGADWQEKINKDMIANLDKTVDNATGILDSLIKKYNELYSAKLKISNMTPEEYAKNNGLEEGLEDTINGMYTDPTTGVKYNKNTDYQQLINDIDAEIAKQEKASGTHDASLDTIRSNYVAARTAKIRNEGTTASGGYTIKSDKGKEFLTDAKNGSTMTGGDGSTWTKDNNGFVTITTKDGKTHTIQGTSVTKSSSGSSSSGSSSKGSSSSSSSSSSKKTPTISGTLSSAISSAISAAKKNSSSTTKKSYATGGVNDSLGIAALHGEKQRAEVIFNAEDAKKLWNYVHNMDSGLGDTIGTAAKALFDRITTTNTDNSTDIHIEHLELPSVKDSNSFVKQLKLVSLNR